MHLPVTSLHLGLPQVPPMVGFRIDPQRDFTRREFRDRRYFWRSGLLFARHPGLPYRCA